MPLPSTSGSHRSALERGPHGTCATCPHPPRPPLGVLARGTYVLHFYEFTTYAAARDATKPHGKVHPGYYKPIPAAHTVHVFRREHGRTHHVARLAGSGQPYKVIVTADDGPVEIFVCLSHFPLPPARVAQYTAPSPKALDALRRRCVRFAPGEQTTVPRARGGTTTYDVVMPDWRRIAQDLHEAEHTKLEALASEVATPSNVRRQLLRQLTLATAAQYAKEQHDPNIWTALQGSARYHVRSRPMARMPGTDPNHYTRVEFELDAMRDNIAILERNIELAAASKYDWLSKDGYREMRWDSLTQQGAQNATVQAEALLLASAPQTRHGRAYLRRYAADPGSWYGHYLWNMRQSDRQAVQSNDEIAAAYWALLAVVGAALVTDAASEADQAEHKADATKWGFTTGAAHSMHRLRDPEHKASHLAKHERELSERLEHKHKRVEEVKAKEEHRVAKARAADLKASAAAKRVPLRAVLKEYVVASVERVTGKAPELVDYDAMTRKLVSARRGARGPWAAYRQAHAAAAANAHQRAAATKQALAHAEHHQRVSARVGEAGLVRAQRMRDETHAKFIDAEEYERSFAHRASFANRAFAAFMVINVAVAVRELCREPNEEHRWKLVGAIAELVYSAEYGVDRSVVLNGRALGEKAVAVRAGKFLLGGVRLAGALGGVIIMVYAAQDAEGYGARHETALQMASWANFTGALMLTTAATVGAIFGSEATEGLAAILGSTGFGLAAAIVLLLASGAILYFTPPPVKQWLMECPWGTSRNEDLNYDQQLQRLLQLICTPEISAKQLMIGGRWYVRVTLRPVIFFPEQSRMTCDLHVKSFASNDYFGVGRDAGWAAQSPEIDIGPLDERTMMRLAQGPVVLSSERQTAGVSRVIARRVHGSVAFDVDIPLSERLRDSAVSAFAPGNEYSVTGTAALDLWSEDEGGGGDGIKLEPFTLDSGRIRNAQ